MEDVLSRYLVVLIGCGQMGSALVTGIVRNGGFPPRQLVCLDVDEQRAQSLADQLDAREDIPDVELDGEGQIIRRPRIYLVAVKPDSVESVLSRLQETFTEEDTVVSVAAGVSTSLLRRCAGPSPGLVRAMPNTPALVGAGVTGVMGDGTVELDAVEALFEGVGKVVFVKKESDFDALTAISGSGPAYFFTAIEALADGGVLMGLDRATAIKLASATVEGAARLVQAQPHLHSAELKDRVASPAGTTIAALAALEEHGFRHALIRAVEAAAQKSRVMTEAMDQPSVKKLLE